MTWVLVYDDIPGAVWRGLLLKSYRGCSLIRRLDDYRIVLVDNVLVTTEQQW